LVEKGKPAKVALTAAMCKFITIVNAMMKQNKHGHALKSLNLNTVYRHYLCNKAVIK